MNRLAFACTCLLLGNTVTTAFASEPPAAWLGDEEVGEGPRKAAQKVLLPVQVLGYAIRASVRPRSTYDLQILYRKGSRAISVFVAEGGPHKLAQGWQRIRLTGGETAFTQTAQGHVAVAWSQEKGYRYIAVMRGGELRELVAFVNGVVRTPHS